MKSKPIEIMLLCAAAALACSCVPVRKLTLLQAKSPSETESTFIDSAARPYEIQNGDILYINAASPGSNLADSLGLSSVGLAAALTQANLYAQGYSVDERGEINYPIAGRLKVTHMTTLQISDTLETLLSWKFPGKNITVTVLTGGITFSTLGEIPSGTHTAYKNKLNILEAVTMAGDISTVGDRNHVQVIRTVPEGIRIYDADLTNRNIVSSPVYFIQPNDVIYVRPLKQKSWGGGANGMSALNSTINIFSSFISTTLSILALTKAI